MAAHLLGLAATGVGDEESPVVGDENLADLKGRGGVLVLGNVGDNSLGDGLTEGVDLRGVSSTGDTETDVHAGEGGGEGGGRRGEGGEEEEGLC